MSKRTGIAACSPPNPIRVESTSVSSRHRMFSRSSLPSLLREMVRCRQVELDGHRMAGAVFRLRQARLDRGVPGAARPRRAALVSNHVSPKRRARAVVTSAHTSSPAPTTGNRNPRAARGCRASSGGM
jgi:hypothetical protein